MSVERLMAAELRYRVVFVVVVLLSVSISAYYRARARRVGHTIARREEGAAALALRVVLTVPLVASILLYGFAPGAMAWSALPLAPWVRWVGCGMGAVCVLAVWWVFRSIGANISETVLTKPDHRLVTRGPYRWVRHPLYAVGLLEILSLGVIAGNWFLMLLSLAGAVVFRVVVIPREEANLVRAFGESYEEYRRRTGAIIPRSR